MSTLISQHSLHQHHYRYEQQIISIQAMAFVPLLVVVVIENLEVDPQSAEMGHTMMKNRQQLKLTDTASENTVHVYLQEVNTRIYTGYSFNNRCGPIKKQQQEAKWLQMACHMILYLLSYVAKKRNKGRCR